MKAIKINIKLENNWLEATWLEDETQIHCESFSGHKEHISLLRAKAKEFNTSLKQFEPLIKQCEDSFIYPTDEEIAKEELNNKIQEAKLFLDKTDKKVLPFYEFDDNDNTLEWYIEERNKSRKFIRNNQ